MVRAWVKAAGADIIPILECGEKYNCGCLDRTSGCQSVVSIEPAMSDFMSVLASGFVGPCISQVY